MRKLSTTYLLLAFVITLIGLGIVILYSTSGLPGVVGNRTDPGYFLRRQLLWIGLGTVAFAVATRIHYQWFRVLAPWLAAFSGLLLVLVLLPGIGVEAKGSSRWLSLGGIRFQPTELAKLSSIVLLSWWMARAQLRVQTFRYGLAVPIGFVAMFAVLILAEPDFGTTVLIAAVGMGIMFIGGTRIAYLLPTGLAGAAGFALLVSQDEERLNRIIAFLDIEKYADGEAYQLVQALYAFVSGGATGLGLGQGIQKRHYLPEAHTDFIFAILGEELGFRATILVVTLYFGIFLCGIWISFRTEDRFGKLLSFGLVTVLTLQAALNIGVVTGSLPTKGITLPFISFGGSSMLMSLLMIGILVNIARDIPFSAGEHERRAVKDRARRI